MGAMSRGLRNIYRNRFRAGLIIFVLGLSIAISTSLQETGASVDEQTRVLRSELETTIAVRPAGYIGMGLVPRTLWFDSSAYEKIRSIPHIVSVERQIAQIESDDRFVPPVSVNVGIEAGNPLRLGGTELQPSRVVDGRSLEPIDEGKNVVVIGKVFARNRGPLIGKEEIKVGDSIPIRIKVGESIHEEKFNVVGIFEYGISSFFDNQVFMPINTFNRIYEVGEGRAGVFFVTVDSVDNVENVERETKTRFEGSVDVLTGQSRIKIASQALQRIQSTTAVGASLSTFAAAAVIVSTLMLVTRERTREIGTLKAIGASNSDIAKQFVTESLALSMLGGALGVAAFALLTPFLAPIVLGPEAVAFLQVTYNPNPLLLIQALGIALLLGLGGSLYPALKAARMDPAEALRYE